MRHLLLLLLLAACGTDPDAATSAAGHYATMMSNCGGDDAAGPMYGDLQLVAAGGNVFEGWHDSTSTATCSGSHATVHAVVDGGEILIEFLDNDGGTAVRINGTYAAGEIEGDGHIPSHTSQYDSFYFTAGRLDD